jgi:hypothetical protein
MKYENINVSREILEAKDGDEFIGCNFAQAKMHTIITDAKELVFTGCNLHNVEIDKSWTVTDCLVHQEDVVETIEPTEEEMKAREIDRAIQTLADLAVDSPDMVSEKMAASADIAAVMKPVDVKQIIEEKL